MSRDITVSASEPVASKPQCPCPGTGVGSATQPPDGFDTGRSSLTARLNQLQGRVPATRLNQLQGRVPATRLNQLQGRVPATRLNQLLGGARPREECGFCFRLAQLGP